MYCDAYRVGFNMLTVNNEFKYNPQIGLNFECWNSSYVAGNITNKLRYNQCSLYGLHKHRVLSKSNCILIHCVTGQPKHNLQFHL